LEVTFKYAPVIIGNGHATMEPGEAYYHDGLARLASALLKVTLGADANPLEPFGNLFQAIINLAVGMRVPNGYKTTLPFNLAGCSPAYQTEVITQPWVTGIWDEYWEVETTVQYPAAAYAKHYGTAGATTLSTSSTSDFGMSIPDYLPNTLLLAAYEEGSLGAADVSVSTDDFRHILPDLPESRPLEYSVTLREAPVVDFHSSEVPALVFPTVTLILELVREKVASVDYAVSIPLDVHVAGSNVMMLTPLYDDATVTFVSFSTSGALEATTEEDFKAAANEFLKIVTFTDPLPTLKHGFWGSNLFNPGDILWEVVAEGGWLNLYFR
jgi:hypothetical protein